jgi:tetratricopeptide (TPR) repeat protein
MKKRIVLCVGLFLLCVSALGFAQTAEDVYYDAAELHNMKDYVGAEALYSKVIEIDPNFIAAYGGRGMVYFETRRYAEALDDFTWLIDRNPENLIALSFRGICYSNVGRYEEALADFEKMMELEPETKYPYGFRGRYYYYELGRYDEALADFVLALEEDPESILALIGRAETYRELGRYDEALFNIKAAMAIINPDDPDLRYIRGSIYAKMGDIAAARPDLEAACHGDSLVYTDDACEALADLPAQ